MRDLILECLPVRMTAAAQLAANRGMADIAVMSYARDEFSGAARCAEKPNRQRDNEILEYENCRAGQNWPILLISLYPLDRDEGFQITSSSSLPGLFLAQRPKTFRGQSIPRPN